MSFLSLVTLHSWQEILLIAYRRKASKEKKDFTKFKVSKFSLPLSLSLFDYFYLYLIYLTIVKKNCDIMV